MRFQFQLWLVRRDEFRHWDRFIDTSNLPIDLVAEAMRNVVEERDEYEFNDINLDVFQKYYKYVIYESFEERPADSSVYAIYTIDDILKLVNFDAEEED